MKVVSPATTSVLRFVPRSENLKKVRKVSISPLPFYVRKNITFQQVSQDPRSLQAEVLRGAKRRADKRRRRSGRADWLQTEKRFVPLPDQPGYGEEPEADYGRVGREDLAQVLGRLARVDDRYALVAGKAGVLESSLGCVVEDDGPYGLQLAPPDALARTLKVFGKTLRGLDEQVVAGLFQAEVEVGGFVAGDDRYLGLRYADAREVLPDIWRAAHPDVVSYLRACGQSSRVQLIYAKYSRLAFQAVGEVGRYRGGCKGENHNREQPHEQPGVASDP